MSGVAERQITFRVIRSVAGALWSSLESRRDLAFENLTLRHRLRLSQVDRVFWTLISWFWQDWRRFLVIVQPDTVIRWHRQAFRLYWRWKSCHRSSGRPKIDVELRSLIRRIADENPTWRAPRVCKEIFRLGFEISPRTVARYMPRRPPCPAAQRSWRTFIANHRDAIAVIDLFVVATLTFRLVCRFFVIPHDRRRVLHANVTEHPTAAWIVQHRPTRR